jgi:phytoene dehydrogenase-like protein
MTFTANGNGKRQDYDAIVVGGGHNGLTAAAYLQSAGLRVCVLEARGVLGGARVTEEVWPGHRVSRASYVVSMLQPKVVADLKLRDFGYDPIPLDPEFATFAADGRPILLPNDEKIAYEQVARVSRKDADALAPFTALFDKAARFLKPMMLKPPPAAGSKRPGDVFELLREAGRAAGLSRRDLMDIFRLMTMSVGDLLDDFFETDELKGAYASSGVVGAWAGPYTPGTAYKGGSDDPHRRASRLDRRRQRPRRRRDACERRDAQDAGGLLRRAPEAHGARPRRRRALPRRGRRGHAPLPQPRWLGEDQRGAV